MSQQIRSRVALAAALALMFPLAACGDDAVEPQSAPSSETSTSRAEQRPTKSARKEQPAGATLSIRVSGDDVSPMGETVEMAAGDPLTVRVTSDRAGELHVHSTPEQYVEFGQGQTRHELRIDQPGQVDVEEHDTGALVARLLVK